MSELSKQTVDILTWLTHNKLCFKNLFYLRNTQRRYTNVSLKKVSNGKKKQQHDTNASGHAKYETLKL